MYQNFFLKSYYSTNLAEICDTESSFIPIGVLFFLDIVDIMETKYTSIAIEVINK